MSARAIDEIVAAAVAAAHEVGRLRGISQAATLVRGHFGGADLPLVQEIRGIFPTPAGQTVDDAKVHDKILGDP